MIANTLHNHIHGGIVGSYGKAHRKIEKADHKQIVRRFAEDFIAFGCDSYSASEWAEQAVLQAQDPRYRRWVLNEITKLGGVPKCQ